MTDQTVNIPLLRKAVEWAEAEAAKPPELCEWVQRFYVLPTDATSPLLDVGSSWLRGARQGKSPECGTCYCIAGFTAAQGDEQWAYGTAHSVAEKALGLTSLQAEDLFMATNTIEDVRRIAEELAGERL